MNCINLKLLQLLLVIVVVESTPLIRNKECYKRLLPKSIIIGVKKSGKYILFCFLLWTFTQSYNNFIRRKFSFMMQVGRNITDLMGFEWFLQVKLSEFFK